MALLDPTLSIKASENFYVIHMSFIVNWVALGEAQAISGLADIAHE